MTLESAVRRPSIRVHSEVENIDLKLDLLAKAGDMHDLRKSTRLAKIGLYDFEQQILDPEFALQAHNSLSEAGKLTPYSEALLVGSLSYNELPARLLGKFKPQFLMGNHMRTKPFHETKSLCDTSEPRTREAMQEGQGLIVANGNMLIKYLGKLVATPTQNFSTERGTFFEGMWYIPTETDIENFLEELFEEGDGRPVITHGRWIPARPVSQPEFYSDIVQEAARKVPKDLKGSMDDRIRWRMDKIETYDMDILD